MESEGGGYLYFCYGSNMSREKLRTRGDSGSESINYDDVWVARLLDWQLCFDMRGAPPTEPAMGSIQEAPADEVYGLVYRLRSEQCWKKLLASEGVTENPTRDSYHVIDVEVECYLPDTAAEKRLMKVRTLMTNPRHKLSRALQKDVRPSQRYMNILIEGAQSELLPKAYVERLRNIKVARKWPESPLRMLMNFVIPLAFISRRMQLRFIIVPLYTLGVFLYAKHEEIVTEGKLNRSREARLLILRSAMFILYGIYAIPAMLLLMFSPKARMFNRRLMTLLNSPSKPVAPISTPPEPVRSSA